MLNVEKNKKKKEEQKDGKLSLYNVNANNVDNNL